MADPVRLDALFDKFLEELHGRSEIPWNNAEYPAGDYEIPESWWTGLEETFPEPPDGV